MADQVLRRQHACCPPQVLPFLPRCATTSPASIVHTGTSGVNTSSRHRQQACTAARGVAVGGVFDLQFRQRRFPGVVVMHPARRRPVCERRCAHPSLRGANGRRWRVPDGARNLLRRSSAILDARNRVPGPSMRPAARMRRDVRV